MNQRVMLSPSAKVGITTVAILVVIVMVGVFLRQIRFGKQAGYEVTFHFDSIRGLKSGADVQRNGLPVGNVVGWDSAADQGVNVKVRFESGEIVIHRNATAFISAENVLGNKVINISEPQSANPQDLTPDGTWAEPSAPRFTIERGTLKAGDPVYRQLADGRVRIGEVAEVTPIDGLRSLALLLLAPDQAISPEEAMVPGFGLEDPLKTVALVFPPYREGDYIEGKREPEATDVLASVDDVIKEVNKLITVIGPEIQSITAHLDDVLINVQNILDKDKIDGLINTLQSELQSAGNALDGIATEIRGILADTRPMLNDTLASVQRTTGTVEGIASDVKSLTGDEEMRAKLESMLTELEASSKELHKVLSDVQSLSGDPEVQSDIKGALKAAKSTLERADSTLEKVTTSASELGGIEFGGYLRERYDTDSKHAFTDFQLEARRPGQDRVYVGGSDIGEGSSLDLGYSIEVNEMFHPRAGLRRGKPGLGAEFYLDPFTLSADAYDANDPKFDLYGAWAFDESWSLVLGLEDILKEDSDDLSVGAQFNF